MAAKKASTPTVPKSPYDNLPVVDYIINSHITNIAEHEAIVKAIPLIVFNDINFIEGDHKYAVLLIPSGPKEDKYYVTIAQKVPDLNNTYMELTSIPKEGDTDLFITMRRYALPNAKDIIVDIDKASGLLMEESESLQNVKRLASKMGYTLIPKSQEGVQLKFES